MTGRPAAAQHLGDLSVTEVCFAVGGTFERLQAGDADIIQEPTEQPYGVRNEEVLHDG